MTPSDIRLEDSGPWAASLGLPVVSVSFGDLMATRMFIHLLHPTAYYAPSTKGTLLYTLQILVSWGWHGMRTLCVTKVTRAQKALSRQKSPPKTSIMKLGDPAALHGKRL